MDELEKKIDNENYQLTWKKFVDGISNSITGMINNQGMYSPAYGESQTRDINIDPKKYTQSEITDMLENPVYNSKKLSSLSQYLENMILQYKRAVKHFASILTFRNDLRCVSPLSDLKNESMFKLAYNRCLSTLRELNIRANKDRIMKKVLTDGAFFVYLNIYNDEYLQEDYVIKGGEFDLLEIPSEFCYITGRTPYGFTYAIDLSWFDRLANSENMAPELYNQYKKFALLRDLKKTGRVSKDELSNAQYYRVEPTKGYVFIYDDLRPQVTPPLQGLFKDALNILDYKNLLKQKSTLDVWKMICLMIPRDKDDNPAIPFNVARDMANVIQSNAPQGTKFFSSPMEPVPIDFANAQNQNNINGLGEQNFWRTAGVNGAITDLGEKSAASLNFGLENDAGFIDHMYKQFENFVNIQLYIVSKKIQFRISYYGNRYTEREDTQKYAELFRTANFPAGKLFGYAGYEPYEVYGSLKQEDILGIKELMTPMVSAFNSKTPKETQKEGRPKKELVDLKESGELQRDYETNNSS